MSRISWFTILNGGILSGTPCRSSSYSSYHCCQSCGISSLWKMSSAFALPLSHLGSGFFPFQGSVLRWFCRSLDCIICAICASDLSSGRLLAITILRQMYSHCRLSGYIVPMNSYGPSISMLDAGTKNNSLLFMFMFHPSLRGNSG